MTDPASSIESIANAADPYERAAQTYPRLSEDQVERVSRFGEHGTLADGALVFERGQRSGLLHS
jgi:thioredoxin reductase (NADPH)